MKSFPLTFILPFILLNFCYSQFNSSSLEFNVPELGETYDDQIYGDNSNYSVFDFNGDGKPDLIDAEDNSSGSVWTNGSQKYWKVYLNTGTAFSSTAIQWNIPDLGETYDDQIYGDNSNYSVFDFNGDGKPDLIDAEDNSSGSVWTNGSQKYWKVYLNTGTAFSNTAIQWNIPDLGETYDDQIYGDYSNYSLSDFNGDNKPDLIDAEDNNSGNVWNSGNQKYWKVYLNTGATFSSSAIQWNIPELGEAYDDQFYGDHSNYSVFDFNGDGKPDLIDAEDNNSSTIWIGGNQKYWKVYLNTGGGFNSSFIQWNIPDLGENFDDQFYGDNSNYTVYDFDGDNLPDLIDAEDNNSGYVWTNGSQKYWKVYSNTTAMNSIESITKTNVSLIASPNPTSGIFSIDLQQFTFPSVSIFNNLGQTIYHEETLSSHIFNFDLKPYDQGIYYIKIKNKNETIQGTIIKIN
ncbi:MAG: T9SS type A sorting domain-containing protein [Saprospiraceae bacterium]|nr:T9SS type A sorting domain-containing protein [Saprospiraceae bacterium]